MDLPEELKSKSGDDIEAWFLEALAQTPLPLDALLAAVQHLGAGPDRDRCAGLADLLQEALTAQRDKGGTLRLLDLRSGWGEPEGEFRATCEQTLLKAFKDREGQAMVKSVGFDRPDAPAGDCLRRLALLTRLRAGVLCHDKTWGFGVVKRLDDFYGKVTIDFTRKPGHQMTFAYAAEALELVGEDHLLTRKHRDPARMKAMVKDDPAGIVRIAVLSYGWLNAILLKEVLVPAILPESEWKGFWDAARKQLRQDPLVEVPSNRNDPIRLLDRAKAYDAAWFEALARENDPDRILALVEEVRREPGADALDPAFATIIGERLGFAIRGIETGDPDLTVRFVLLAKAFGFTGELPVRAGAAAVEATGARSAVVDVRQVSDRLLSEKRLVAAASAMSARDVEKFFAHLADFDRPRLTGVLLAALPRLSMNALAEAMKFLAAEKREADAAAAMAGLLGPRAAGPVVLLWLCRNLDAVAAWGNVRLPDLLAQAMDAVGSAASGENLRAQKHLRELFLDRDWLELILDSLDHSQREAFVARLYASKGWPEADKRSVLVAIIKMFPDLTQVVTGGADEPASGAAARFTSWRSYRERQDQLRKMIEVTIPENSREIAVGRSYGDLRENFEYQTAKDRQRLLLRRKREMEDDLASVRGRDFKGLPAEKAGLGTCVTLQRADGRVERFCILGEWDRDEKLGIIANRSKLAEALAGHGAGETVTVPGAAGEETCRLVEVTGLTAEIHAWVAGDGAAG